jgi:hypothetical protein
MEQLAIVARLKPGTEPRAAELIAQGAPFDPSAIGLRRHAIFLSAGEVVFLFEGDEVEWTVDSLIDEPFHWDILEAFEDWRAIIVAAADREAGVLVGRACLRRVLAIAAGDLRLSTDSGQ